MEAQVEQETKGSGSHQAIGVNQGLAIKVDGDSTVYAIGTLTSHNNQTLHLELNIQPAQTDKPLDEAAQVHNEWRISHERDKEFVRETRIAAVGGERVALQRLLTHGAKAKQIKELWQIGLLRYEDGRLTTRRPRSYPIAGVTAGALMGAIAAFYLLVFVAAESGTSGQGVAMLMFVAMTVYGVYAIQNLFRPWMAVAKVQPLVDRVNRTGEES